jgi:hypothetical protein
MEKVDSSVNLKLLVGQVAIIFLILGGLGLSYLNFSTNSCGYAILIFCWTLAFVTFGMWTRHNPKLAFLTSLVFHSVTIVIKDIFLGGEYILPFLFHIYFIVSMVVGINSVQKKTAGNIHRFGARLWLGC